MAIDPAASQGRSPTPGAYIALGVAAVVLGSFTSFAVWLFNQAIDLVHGVAYGPLEDALAPIGPGAVVVILALAGLLVWPIVRLVRPERTAAMGHIIDGVAEHEGRLDNHNATVVVAGAGVGLGMGIPVGSDTPSAMIGGHVGSWVAIRLGWPVVFVQSLIVAGVGAGISATFLAQLAAVFFALEVVLGGFGGAVFVVPTLLAVASAALTTFKLTGTPPIYALPADAIRWDASTVLYLVGALLAALAAIAYVRLLGAMKPAWARLRMPAWARMAIAGAIVGLVAIWLPDVLGSGTSTMRALFGGATMPLAVLIGSAVAKTILTPSSLGAGFVGGVIGPAMLIGSTIGAATGTVIIGLVPDLGLSPVVFAMVATTAMLAGSFHAPLFGAMMIFEMTGDYRMLVPLLAAAAIGYGTARPFQAGSAYTLGFPALGIHLRPGRYDVAHRTDPSASG